MLNGKRGQTVLDLLMVIVVLLILGIVAVFGYKIYDELNTDLQADPDITAEAKAQSTESFNIYPSTIDNAFLTTLVLLWILLLVTSFMIDTHPIFFILTFILLLFVFVVAMVIGNTYQDIVADTEVSAFASSFPVINWVMSNFLIIIIAMGLTTTLALYSKNRFG